MNKKYLIAADFSTRLKFYNEAIKKTLVKGKSIIILVPDLSMIPYFSVSKNTVSILHAGMTKTERWLTWDKIRHGQAKIIIGSQSALFSPVVNLGLIIIDQEENETYKNDRSPRFHAVEVAEKLAELARANLILGSLVPRIETYYKVTQNKFQILTKKSSQKSNINIVDMNSEKYVISNSLEKAIEEEVNNNKRVLLVLNRKGEGTKFSCKDCGWIATCQKCGLPLIPQNAENVCYRCEKKFPQPTTCPKCKNIHLRPMGLGTSRLKKFLTDLFLKAKIIQMEKEHDGKELKSNWDIAITTTYGLKFQWPKIGLVGIIDADLRLSFPDFSSPQKTFQEYFKFLKIGERGLIQTHLVENYVIKALAGQNYQRFFLDEIAQRKKFNLPPYTRLIRLLFKSVDKEELLKETTRVYNKLSILITNNRLPITVSSPYACFIAQERGKYRYQIVIKSSKSISNFPSLISVLRSLPRGWIIDVNPVNLL